MLFFQTLKALQLRDSRAKQTFVKMSLIKGKLNCDTHLRWNVLTDSASNRDWDESNYDGPLGSAAVV